MQWKQFFDAALMHHKTGDLVRAEALYQKALIHDPDQPHALHLLGVTLHQSGRHEAALSQLERAIALAPREAAFHLSRGNVLRALRRFSDAAQAYRRAHKLRPDLAEAPYNLATVLEDLGDPEGALAAYREALHLRPQFLEALCNMGLLLKHRGQIPEAVEALRSAYRLAPQHPSVALNLAGALVAAGSYEQADACYSALLREHEGHPGALLGLAHLRLRQDRPEEAIPFAEQARAMDPEDGDAAAVLGSALRRLGRLEAAEACYREALQKPRSRGRTDLRNNLGLVLHDRGRAAEAVACFEEALRTPEGQADEANLLYNLAVSLLTQAEFPAPGLSFEEHLALRERLLTRTCACLSRCLELTPRRTDAWLCLGTAHKRLGNFEASVSAHEQALAILHDAAAGPKGPDRPRLIEVLSNLGTVYHEQGRPREAIGCFEQALALGPSPAREAEVRFNLSLSLLLAGDLLAGFTQHEARWDTPLRPRRKRLVTRPRWDGSPLRGRTLLVVSEQGLGDTLQFCRFARAIDREARSAAVVDQSRVVLEVPPDLVGLLQGSRDLLGNAEVIVQGDAPPFYDVYTSFLSLPYLLQIHDESALSAYVPYLRAPARAELPAPRGQDMLRVGLAWAGNALHGNDHRRSCPLSALRPLIELSFVQLYSLQKGPRAADLQSLVAGGGIIDLDALGFLGDFQATAEAVASLDLIISVDTSVAHLCGALARPLWLLLPYAPDWRWMMGRPDSPWYPTMRLFRQPSPGDFTTLCQQVCKALQSYARHAA